LDAFTCNAVVAEPQTGFETDPHARNRSLMPFVLIIHEVRDYALWKAVFDKAEGIRKAAGELSYQLLKFETDANNVVHFSRWTSLDNARRFFESPELIEIRRNAGVKNSERHLPRSNSNRAYCSGRGKTIALSGNRGSRATVFTCCWSVTIAKPNV
jgi:heme-degrading monooxygenase HmoA